MSIDEAALRLGEGEPIADVLAAALLFGDQVTIDELLACLSSECGDAVS